MGNHCRDTITRQSEAAQPFQARLKKKGDKQRQTYEIHMRLKPEQDNKF